MKFEHRRWNATRGERLESASEVTVTIDVPESRVDPATCLPPRHVPVEAYLGAFFGGTINQLGWIFFGFGMIFFWVFAWNSELVGSVGFLGDKDTVSGVIQRVEPTNATENDSPVYMIAYRFVTRDGSPMQGKAYVTGGGWRGGETVMVEYLRRDPSISRIPGTRRSMFGAAGAFAAVFPLIGFVIILSQFPKSLRASLLLSRGHLAYGKLVSQAPTNVTVNGRPVMAMTFEFRAPDGMSHRIVSKTTQSEALEDETQEMLLYDAANPRAAVLVDELPGLPDVLPDRGIVLRAPRAVWMVLILPLVTLIGHGGYLFYLMSR